MDTIKELLGDPAVLNIIIGVVGVILAFFQRKMANSSADKNAHITKDFKMADIRATALRVVMSVAQRRGKYIKEAASDGKFTKEERLMLFEEAKRDFDEELSSEAKHFMRTEFPNQEKFIRNTLEAGYAIYKAMSGTKATPNLKMPS